MVLVAENAHDLRGENLVEHLDDFFYVGGVGLCLSLIHISEPTRPY